MTEAEIILALEDIEQSFSDVIKEIKVKKMKVSTEVLDLIDKINSLSVEV